MPSFPQSSDLDSTADTQHSSLQVYNCSLSDVLVTSKFVTHKYSYGCGGCLCTHGPVSKAAEKEIFFNSVARPKFSATARVASAIEAAINPRSGHRILWWINSGVKHDGVKYTYSPKSQTDSAYLPLGLKFDIQNRRHLSPAENVGYMPATPGLPAEEYTWHPGRSTAAVNDVAARGSPPEINEVMFPVLATVLPKWITGFVEDAGGAGGPKQKIKRILYLVSGYGAPVDSTHAPESNSTEATARVMKAFVNRAYPDIDVRLAHSGNGVFRYDKNVSFVNEKLRPAIANDRNVVAAAHGEQWVKRFKLTVALCDGTPARLNALMNAFRDMKPYLAHAFQLKRFWQSGLLDTRDVDIQRWARAESAPATYVGDIERVFSDPGAGTSDSDKQKAKVDASVTLKIVEEMRKHRDAFKRVGDGEQNSHELVSFWLRKTRKPVLAVLCVLKPGSTQNNRSTLTIDDYEFHKGVNLEVSMPTGSLCSERNAIGNALASNPALRRQDMFGIAVLSLRARDIDGGMGTEESWGNISRNPSFVDLTASGPNALCAPVPPDTPLPPDDLTGLNPLRPCGACKEWLNKIAEVNPGFRVLMFTDVTCGEVFVKEVGQC